INNYYLNDYDTFPDENIDQLMHNNSSMSNDDSEEINELSATLSEDSRQDRIRKNRTRGAKRVNYNQLDFKDFDLNKQQSNEQAKSLDANSKEYMNKLLGAVRNALNENAFRTLTDIAKQNENTYSHYLPEDAALASQ